jgi:hypothetical protein
MILVFGMLDRALDLVGICTLMYWTWRAARRLAPRKTTPK